MGNLAYLRVALLLIFSVKLKTVHSFVVTCNYQQEVCECPSNNENECIFKLEIEELQTFTSYEQDLNGEIIRRRIPGYTYYLNGDGYNVLVRPAAERQSARCYLVQSITTDDGFRSAICGAPMTVDGVTYRMFIAVNGRIPGPTLIVPHKSLVRVQVQNSLTSEGITIHWHGMHQKRTPWMDGVGLISQPLIGPGATFDYVFNATPAGTHWYHSHVGAQRTDGLFGALIVREKNFESSIMPAILSNLPYGDNIIEDFPERHTLTLLDWQREASLNLFTKIHSNLGFYPQENISQLPMAASSRYSRTYGPDNIEVGPVPYWTGLINGRGRMNDTTYAPLSIFSINRGSYYRFRVVGAQSLYAYSLSIDNHKLRVIATDGNFIEPVLVDFLVVHSGERYDFIPELDETTDQNKENFWIRAETLEASTRDSNGNAILFTSQEALAILTYGDIRNPDLDWTTRYTQVTDSKRVCTALFSCNVLNCPFRFYQREQYYKNCTHLTGLIALDVPPREDPPSSVTPAYLMNNVEFFNFGFEGDSFTSAINGRNFRLPVTPYQTYCGRYDKSDSNSCSQCPEDPNSCNCINVRKIAQSETFNVSDTSSQKTVIMVFSAVGSNTRQDFAHPIHLHGHSFYVLHIGHGTYNAMTGQFLGNSPDVMCDNMLCANPGWAGGVVPNAVIKAAGSINNTLIRKDTVIVPAGGYVVVAFRADNPGYWFLHCHIEVHQLEGMAVLIEEYNYKQHWKEPEGINDHGDFRWDISDYRTVIKEGATCGAGKDRAPVIVLHILGFIALLVVV